MKIRITHLAKALATTTLASFLCAGGPVLADDSAFTFTGSIGPMTGEQIYNHICTGCHMAGGQGAVGAGFYPKLAGDPKLASWEYAAITVLNGRNGMPPFGLPKEAAAQTRAIQLSDAQVADVVNYVRTHFDNKYKSHVTEKQVQALPHPQSIAVPF